MNNKTIRTDVDENRLEPKLKLNSVPGGSGGLEWRNRPPWRGAQVQGGIASTSRGTSAWFKVGLRTTGNTQIPGRKQATAAMKLKSDRRMAEEIVARYGGRHSVQKSEQHTSILEWARRLLSGLLWAPTTNSQVAEVAWGGILPR